MVRFALLAGLLLATASCKTQYQPQTVEVKDPGPPQRVLPTIRVLDAGMTPRAPLRPLLVPRVPGPATASRPASARPPTSRLRSCRRCNRAAKAPRAGFRRSSFR